MCVRKNTSQPANVRAFGACAAAGCILFKSERQSRSLLRYHIQLQSLSFFGVRLIRTPMSGAALLPS